MDQHNQNGVNESPFETLRRIREGDLSNQTTQFASNIAVSDDTVSRDAPNRESDLESPIVRFVHKLQLLIILITVALIPSFIIPFPWGWGEYSKGVLLILSVLALLSLQLIRTLFSRKFIVTKSGLDIALVIVIGSAILSTIFSNDLRTSLLGFEDRMGTGLVALISMFLFSIVARSVIRRSSYFHYFLYAIHIGITASAFLSILSFAGVNLFGWIGSMDSLFVAGLPLMASATTGVLVWGSGVLLNFAHQIWKDGEMQLSEVMLPIFSLINIAALLLFTLNQGAVLLFIFLLAAILICGTTILFRKHFSTVLHVSLIMVTLLFALGFGLFRIDSVRTPIAQRSNAITQIGLPSESTWQIVTSTLSQSAKSGVVGFGVDTFSIYYNMNKPAFLGELDISETNFTFGSSEILTVMGNQGMLGVLVWLAFGVLILYFAYRTFSNSTSGNPKSKVTLLTLDILLLTLFLASFFHYYGFLGYFLLFILLTIRVIAEALVMPTDALSYIMKLDLLVDEDEDKANYMLPAVLSLIGVVITLIFAWWIVKDLRAGLSVLVAEDKYMDYQTALARESGSSTEGQPVGVPLEEREKRLVEIIDRYGDAVSLNAQNGMYHRRRAVLIVEYISLLVEKARGITDELGGEEATEEELAESEELAAVQAQLVRAVELATEESREATEISPLNYANWDARGYLFAQLVNLNLINFAQSGVNAIDQAVRLNPSSYTNYFRGAQLLVVSENLEQANLAVSRALTINPNHIPSLLLATEINIAAENFENSKALLERAKLVLEAIDAKESDVYQLVSNRLEQVEKAIETGSIVEEKLDPEALPSEEDDPAKSVEAEGTSLTETTTPTESVETELED